MTPRRTLAIANLLMAAGIAPLLLAELFVAATLAGDWQADSRREAVAQAMFVAMLYTGALSVVCALPACIWSWRTARRHPELAGGRVLRKLVCVLLAAPPAALFLYPHG